MIEPGIHHAIDFETYAGWPCVNSGAVRAGLKSMRRMKAMLDGELDGDDSRDRKFGRAAHCRLLEPDVFDIRFATATPCVARKKDNNVCGNTAKYQSGGEWFCGVHKPEGAEPVSDFVSVEELDRIDAMIDSLKTHKAVNLLRAHGGHEVSLVADVFGVRCKARYDKLIDAKQTIVDVKKIRAGSIGPVQAVQHFDRLTEAIVDGVPRPPEEIEKAITNYGYYVQAALYKLIADELTGGDHRFMFVFIEDRTPYDCCVVELDRESFEIGKHEVRLVLDNWTAALESGEFGGVYAGITRGGVKDWKRNQFNNWGFKREDDDGDDGTDEADDGDEFSGEFC